MDEAISCRFCGNMNSLIPYLGNVATEYNYQCRSCGGYVKQDVSGCIRVGVAQKKELSKRLDNHRITAPEIKVLLHIINNNGSGQLKSKRQKGLCSNLYKKGLLNRRVNDWVWIWNGNKYT